MSYDDFPEKRWHNCINCRVLYMKKMRHPLKISSNASFGTNIYTRPGLIFSVAPNQRAFNIDHYLSHCKCHYHCLHHFILTEHLSKMQYPQVFPREPPCVLSWIYHSLCGTPQMPLLYIPLVCCSTVNVISVCISVKWVVGHLFKGSQVADPSIKQKKLMFV